MGPREFVEQELKLVNELFDKRKEIHPMFVLVKGDDRFLIPVEFPSSARKDIIAQGIKDLVKKAEPDVVIYISEAWMMAIKSLADRLPIPSQHPDRVEIVAVHIEFKTGEKFGCQAKIIRGENVTLEKFDVWQDDMSMGRFCDFFPIGRTN